MNSNATAPVLFLIFNRPDTTAKVFEAIRQAKPRQLFIAADGPRKARKDDIEGCELARRVVDSVDWDCEVHRLFRDENMGCGPGVSSAISWFFEHVPEGIILEDDTLPTPDFFRFCTELLEYYRNDTRIMAVSGSCLPNRMANKAEYSYFFSNWDYIWGWATWRRSWKYYDYNMKSYEKALKLNCFHKHYTSIDEFYYIKHHMDLSYYESKKVSWWSVQWGFARKVNSGLVAVTNKNMVINLGLGNGATNTHDEDKWNFLKHEKVDFPLKHPEFVVHDRVTDDEIFKQYFTTPFTRLKSRVRRVAENLQIGGLYNWLKLFKSK